VGETRGRTRKNDTQSRETAAAVVGQQSLMEMLSPFQGFPVDVVLIPRVDTYG